MPNVRAKPRVSARAGTAHGPGTGFRAGPEASSQVYINKQLTLSVPGERVTAAGRAGQQAKMGRRPRA